MGPNDSWPGLPSRKCLDEVTADSLALFAAYHPRQTFWEATSRSKSRHLEAFLRCEADTVPLVKLRYRWPLRRRASWWKRRAARR